MRRLGALFFVILLSICPVFVSAQEGGYPDETYPEDDYPEDGYPEEDDPGDWVGFVSSLYSAGDKTFNISLGVVIPLVFTDSQGDALFSGPTNILVGGTGSLGYNYFLGSHVFVGGEVQGMFAKTLSEHMFYMVPLTARVGYQFVVRRFEFPFSLGLGIAPTRYQEDAYVGFFMKPAASAFFRFNPDWSFGLNTAWWWSPQWTGESARDAYGNFMEITLSARYHF
jgi:hypothetical protein